MGYRSDVAFEIVFNNTPEGEAMFNTFIAEIKARTECAEAFKEDIALEINEADKRVHYNAGSVKWYDDYEDVQALNKVYRIAEEYAEQWSEENTKDIWEAPICGSFVRIGEDLEDNEEKRFGGDFAEGLYIYRSIGGL